MSATIAQVRGVLFLALHPRRLLSLIATFFAGIVYVWIAAVRSVPGVKRRKADAREAWRTRDRTRPDSS